MFKNIVIDFFNFIKRPNDSQLDISVKQKFKFVLYLLVFEIILTFVVLWPLFELVNLVEKIKEHKIDYSETLLFTFFFVVFFVPVVEEFVFRYILRYKELKIRFISRFNWNKIFPILVYLLTLTFGLIHLTNFTNESYLFLFLSPIIVSSQIIGGFILAFIRVRINFIWCIFYHFVWNFIFAIAFPIVDYQFSKPFVEDTKSYKISIREIPFFNKNKEQTLKIDSIGSRIKKIKVKQYSLQNLLDTLFIKEKYYVDDVLIELNFTDNEYKTKEEILKILRKKYDIIE